jgi:hypothetical protein
MPQEEPKTKGGGTFIEAVKDSLAAAGRYAMLGALDVLATTPISTLRGHKLEAEDFDRLMVGDTVRDLLAWIGPPKATREGWDAPSWSAFCSRCREEFEFDPVSEGDLVAAERLRARKGYGGGSQNRRDCIRAFLMLCDVQNQATCLCSASHGRKRTRRTRNACVRHFWR